MFLQRLRWRILFYAGMGALLTGLFIGNATVSWLFHLRIQHMVGLPEGLLRAVERCEEDPSRWRPGRAISRSTLAEKVSISENDRLDRTIDSHVSRLRQKLGGASSLIRTVWGIGWRFDLDSERPT